MSLFLLKLAHYYSFLLALDQLMNRFLIFRGGKKNNKCRELVPSTNRCESVRAHWVCSALWPSGTAHCCCGGHPLHLLHPGIYSAQQGRFQQGFIPFTHPVRSWVLRGDGSLGVLEAEWSSSCVLWWAGAFCLWGFGQLVKLCYSSVFTDILRGLFLILSNVQVLSPSHTHTSMGNVLAPGKIQTQIFECLPEKYLYSKMTEHLLIIYECNFIPVTILRKLSQAPPPVLTCD